MNKPDGRQDDPQDLPVTCHVESALRDGSSRLENNC